jgi:hypothetical protein
MTGLPLSWCTWAFILENIGPGFKSYLNTCGTSDWQHPGLRTELFMMNTNFLFNFTRDMFPNRVMNAGFLCGGKIYCVMRNSEVLYCCVMWNLWKCTSDCYRTTLIVRIPFPWHLLAGLQSHVVVPWLLFAWLLDWFRNWPGQRHQEPQITKSSRKPVQ